MFASGNGGVIRENDFDSSALWRRGDFTRAGELHNDTSRLQQEAVGCEQGRTLQDGAGNTRSDVPAAVGD